MSAGADLFLLASMLNTAPTISGGTTTFALHGYGNKYGQNRCRARIRRQAWMSRCSSCNKPSPLRRALVSLCCIRAPLLLTCTKKKKTKKKHLPWWFYAEATLLFCLVYTNIVIFLPLPSCCSCSVSLFLSLSSLRTHRPAVPVWRHCRGLRGYGAEPKVMSSKLVNYHILYDNILCWQTSPLSFWGEWWVGVIF